MNDKIATCEYCGSTMMVTTNADLLEDELKHYAVQQCTCEQAVRYRALVRAHETITEICDPDIKDFEPLPDEVVTQIKALAELIIDSRIRGGVLTTRSERIKVGMSVNNGIADITVSREKKLLIER